MKKVTSLLLVFICCLAMSVPAFATASTPTVELLLPDGDAGERIVFNQSGSVSLEETICDLESEGIVPYDYPANAGIVQISAYPLMQNDDDPSDLFYYSNIGGRVTFNSYGQYDDLELTYAQTQYVYATVFQAMDNEGLTADHTYTIVGWVIEAIIVVRADNPLYIHWRVLEPNFGLGTSYETAPVTSNISNITLIGPCEFPEGTDVTTTTRFRLKGIDGLFYYRTSTGQTVGIPFAAGITLNA